MKKLETDMTSGPLLGKLIRFSLPLVLTGILQLLYNAVDMVVVGRYDGSQALAAVGATGPVVNLVTNLFIGMSLGASVLVAQYIGAHSDTDVFRTVHTAMLLSVISGVIVCGVGVAITRPMLVWMETPDDVLDQAAQYMRIYFVSMIAAMVFNFGASILRAVGDAKRPLYFLVIAGMINVVFNVWFVKYLGMGVAGVAWATMISQTVAAVLVTLSLVHADGCWKLNLRMLHIDRDKLWRMLRIGLPAGLQNSMFSISNVLIQSAINTFGSAAIAGTTAAANLESFISSTGGSIAQATLTFAGQNIGAGKPRRVARVTHVSSLLGIAVTLVMGGLMLRFGPQLLGIYSDDPAVIAIGMIRVRVVAFTFPALVLMNVYAGSLRGMGHSASPMIVTLMGVCVFRVVWIYTVFELYPTLRCLFISYPVTWALTAAFLAVIYYIVQARTVRRYESEAARA